MKIEKERSIKVQREMSLIMIEENHNSMLLTSFDWIIIVDYTSTVDHIHFLDQHYHIIIEWFRDNRDKRISYKENRHWGKRVLLQCCT